MSAMLAYAEFRESVGPRLLAVFSVALAAWFGCVWFLLSPVYVKDEAGSSRTVQCESPVRAAQLVGVPDASSLDPLERQCRDDGRIRVAGLIALQGGVVAAAWLVPIGRRSAVG